MKGKQKICLVLLNIMIVIAIMYTTIAESREKNQIEGMNDNAVHESEQNVAENNDDHETVVLPANDLLNDTKEDAVENEYNAYQKITYSKDWDSDDAYLLAKIAMAEAEGESFNTKVLVILTVLNRVHSKEFPNSIQEVIYERKNGVYQFIPVISNKWKTLEPSEECWNALRFVQELEYDISNGALYFEACKGDSWHSRNLELICQSDNTRFYK